MTIGRRGTSATEAEQYLESAYAACAGFELLLLTAAEADELRRLREALLAKGAQLSVARPSAEAVLEAPRLDAAVSGGRQLVRWIESGDDDESGWRELAVLLNRSRERLRAEHAYLWVLAGSFELRRLMTVHAQDIYSGALKAPHVTAHAGAEIGWMQLSDLQLGSDLRLGESVARHTKFRQQFLADLELQFDTHESPLDLILVSGDLARRGHSRDYVHVDEFFDWLLAALERRRGLKPIVLAVPGNHDLARPGGAIERWPYELLWQHDAEDERGQALRELLWQDRDASLIEPLFAAYQDWARGRVLGSLHIDEVGLAPGVCHVRSLATSHIPGDWSVVVEKDDLRLGVVGLNTAWADFGGERSEGQLPFEQFEAALGEAGIARLDDMHSCVLLTHHGPDALSQRSQQGLADRLDRLPELRVHVHALVHSGQAFIRSAPVGPMRAATRPFLPPGTLDADMRPGYCLVRVDRNGRAELRSRVFDPGTSTWWSDAPPGPGVVVVSPSIASSERVFAEELHKYLAELLARYAYANMLGFPGIRIPIPLEHQAVRLVAVGEHVEHDVELPLAQVFEYAQTQGRRGVVLLGDPGSGKTTLLQQLLLTVARDGSESIGLPDETIPVFLRLSEVRELELATAISEQWRDLSLVTDPTFARRLVAHGKLLLLFDGLDEVAVDARPRVARWIEQLIRTLPNAFVLVTSRYAGYTHDVDHGFVEFHLRPSDDEQVRRFVHSWYSAVEHALGGGIGTERRARERAEDLLSSLSSDDFVTSSRTYELTRNPLSLAAICLVHRDLGRIPRARASLFALVIETLLRRWNQRSPEPPLSVEDTIHVLRSVAAYLHGERGRIWAATAELLGPVTRALAQLRHATLGAQEFLVTVRDESGVLVGEGPDSFGFPHLAFQELLTAEHMRNSFLHDSQALEELAAKFDDSWWQEVILLLLGPRNPSMFEPFMRALVCQPGFAEWANGQFFDLCFAHASEISAAPFTELLLGADDGRDAFEARQVAAARLLTRHFPGALDSLLDTLRSHPNSAVRGLVGRGVLPELPSMSASVVTTDLGRVELVRVPGGRFIMGSPSDESEREPDEGPQHEVELSEFLIARTPVTNAQYAEYLAGHRDAPKPRYWSDRRYNQPEQPVVGVSWDEAAAFCDWSGLVLPTEAQWEYACRAGSATRYWSGDGEADLARVGWYLGNSDGRLRAVRSKPANRFGLYDTHGGVLEWCLDEPAPYTLAPRRGDGLRRAKIGMLSCVVRGGSWAGSAAETRSAARGSISPSYRLPYLGFRPILQSPG